MRPLPACLLLAPAYCAALASDIPPPRPVDVAAIVRRLGSEDFSQREEASRHLSTLSVDAPPPELLAARNSPNPEIRDRARRAVKALELHIVRERERADIEPPAPKHALPGAARWTFMSLPPPRIN